MKSKIKLKLKLYLLLLVLLMINQSNCYAQVNTLDDKNALLFWMKVNNFSLDDQFFRSYLEITKGREYKLYQNDEFGYSKFYNNSKIEYSNDLKNIDFTKRFVISKIVDIGGYNFQRNSFPLLIDYTEYFGQLNPTNRLPYSYKNISAEVFNSSYIQKELKMSEVNAEALIQKRKTSDGQVNRKFLSKIEYSIMNLPSQTDPNNLVLYIHNITIYDDSGILSVITPREDYYDKVNGLKLKDGTEKIFFDINWKELQKGDSLGASFYRIINYKEGKIYNPVIDYYISGKPQMIGYYPINLITKNGLFQWFYDNGQIIQQINYDFGMMNGLYQSWYSNGSKKEEVNYIFNKKNGCDYMWSEDGRCLEHGLIAEWANTDNYFSYLENGKVIDYSKACPCFKRNDQNAPKGKDGPSTVPNSPTNLSINTPSSNESIKEVKSSPINNFIGHFNNELPVGDYKVFQKFIYYKTKSIDIFSASFQNKDVKELSELIVNPGDPLVLNLNTSGIPFFRKGSYGKSQAKYSLAIQIEDSTGKEYYSEISNKELFQEGSYNINISININPEKLQLMSSAPNLFLNFFIKDRFIKEGVLQGFAKFKIQK